MVYKKVSIIAVLVAVMAGFVSNFVFGAVDITSNDKIYDATMQVLIFIQKYSWPVLTLILLYALYKFYVAGSELIEHKITGQRMIVGISIFAAIIQTLPLLYAFLVVK
jgi:hypothetical protein